MERNWVVVMGSFGVGFELLGPFHEEEANNVRDELRTQGHDDQAWSVRLGTSYNWLREEE